MKLFLNELQHKVIKKLAMKIEVFFIPSLPESDEMFRNSIVIYIDVLRAGTTLVTALHNGAKEVIPVESLDKAINIYSNLSRETRFLGGERNGLKPNGFNAGNSPKEYSLEAVEGKTIVLTTTNGSKIFQKAKNATYRMVGCFVNKSTVENFIIKKIEQEPNIDNIFILCAGTNGKLSMEDTLCAGAFVDTLVNKLKIDELSDSSRVAVEMYNLHKHDLNDYIKVSEHSKFLNSIGFNDDVEVSLTQDLYDIVPLFSGISVKK